jgi:dolichyl-phosphate beta-glucosyltransferase
MGIREKDQNIYLSLIIPVYNGLELLNKSLPVLVEFFKGKTFSYEIIVVDDGSKNSEFIREKCNEYNIKYLFNAHNRGKGAALREGFLESTGKFVMFTDTDLPYGTRVIDLFVKYLDFKEFDLVVGDRTMKGSFYYKGITVARSIGSKFIAKFISNMVTGGFPDTQCGIKGFRSEAAKKIFETSKINRFAIDIEIIYLALKNNFDIKRLPVSLANCDGNSVRPVRDGFKILFDSFRIIYYYKTGQYHIYTK